METADLRDFVDFEEGQVIRRSVFESERLWAQVLCIDRNRGYGPVGDPDSDAVITVMAGEAVVQVDRSRSRLKQWGTALVPARMELTVTNASAEPLVVLLTVAPPPTPRTVTA
ncbi:MAG: hypothetical protein ACRDI0_07560 [Actinomycetota bacterium]